MEREKKEKDSKYELHLVDNDVICFYHSDSNIKNQGNIVPYHRHDAYEIYLFLEGNTDFYLEKNCYRLQRGDMVAVAPAQLHRSVCLDDGIYRRYGINIKPFLLDRLSSVSTDLKNCFSTQPGRAHLARLSESEIEQFISMFDNLKQALGSTEYGQDIMALAETAKLLVFVNRIFYSSDWKPENIMPKLVGDIMSYIEEHLTEEISLEGLAQKFYLSHDYISRQFKRATGLTIRSYLLDQRICRAKTCLLEGKSVTQACLESGFSDYANFIRSFTKHEGISPGKYKKIM